MVLIPLVTPIVTPKDPQYSVDTKFVVPPPSSESLTSSASYAQNDPIPTFGARHSTKATNPPIETDINPSLFSTRLADSSPKTCATKARPTEVRASPLTKPRRKRMAMPNVNLDDLGGSGKSAVVASEQFLKITVSTSAPWGDASDSPEALSEMQPPPLLLPSSARKRLCAQPNSGNRESSTPPAVSLNEQSSLSTPASLFNMSPGSRCSAPDTTVQAWGGRMNIFQRPESLISLTHLLTPPGTQRPAPSLPEVDNAKILFPSLPSPAYSKLSQPGSRVHSPQLLPTTNTSNTREAPTMTPRCSNNGQSSSLHASVALPAISPSLKPLLPGSPGMSAKDMTSHLLVIKSNYENILEGNMVPGVSYPSELLTSLTSKQTQHKVAEQCRRNRLNSALQTIATLLPSHVKGTKVPGRKTSGDKNEDTEPDAANTKASTIELAIKYIRQLQREAADANARAQEAEMKVEETVSIED